MKVELKNEKPDPDLDLEQLQPFELSFWQKVYIASLQGGLSGHDSSINADRAITRQRTRWSQTNIGKVGERF